MPATLFANSARKIWLGGVEWLRGKRRIVRGWLKRSYIHILIVALLLIYIFSANSLYIKFFLKDGKPISSGVSLPAQSQDVDFELDKLTPVVIDKQDFYSLTGFAFIKTNRSMKNNIRIVLTSSTQTLIFSTKTVDFPSMIKSYSGYQPGMDQAEFQFLLSKGVLKPGTYQLGILLEQQGGTRQTYVITGSTIQTTPNTIRYTAATK